MSTDQKVEGSNPSGRATIYRRFLRFFSTFCVAMRIGNLLHGVIKYPVFAPNLHKICTKSAQNLHKKNRLSGRSKCVCKKNVHKLWLEVSVHGLWAIGL